MNTLWWRLFDVSSKSLLIFAVKVPGIFNSSLLLRNILSTLRVSSRCLDKCYWSFRLLLWRWPVAWSTNNESSVINCSKVSTARPVCAAFYTQAPYLLKVWFMKIFIYIYIYMYVGIYIYIYIYIYIFNIIIIFLLWLRRLLLLY